MSGTSCGLGLGNGTDASVRMVTASLLRSAATITVLVVLYYTAPLDRGPDPGASCSTAAR
jgi:hypothetical protein